MSYLWHRAPPSIVTETGNWELAAFTLAHLHTASATGRKGVGERGSILLFSFSFLSLMLNWRLCHLKGRGCEIMGLWDYEIMGLWDYGDRIFNAKIAKAQRTQRFCRVRSAPTPKARVHAPGRAGRRPGRTDGRMAGCPVVPMNDDPMLAHCKGNARCI